MDKDQIIQTLQESNAALTQTNKELQATIKDLQDTIKDLQNTIKDLQNRLNQNSQNSSMPPSKDGFNKPKPRSLRPKSEKKPGGQKGHAGSHMSIPHEPDEVCKHLPARCALCPHLSECLVNGKVFSCVEKRYEVNAVITTKVTEHQMIHVSACPCGGESFDGVFPEGIKAYVQYGDSISVLTGLLSTYGAISIQRIHDLLGGLLGVSLSTGTIASMVSKCARKVGDVLTRIKSLLTGKEVVHFDETGTDVNGKTIWVHNSSTAELTYQTINAKRGQDGMDGNGVLPDFNGIAVHDCWSPYWKYSRVTHAVCNAHLMRELNGVEQYSPEHNWAKKFKSLLIAMKKAKEDALKDGKKALCQEKLHQFNSEYDELMKLADLECPDLSGKTPPTRGRRKKGKERSLIERLKLYKGSVCLFINDFNVPFDNNQAERDVRNVKTKTKVSGCFRTESGAQDYLDVMSYISTGKKHGVSAFEALTAAFNGHAEIVLQ